MRRSRLHRLVPMTARMDRHATHGLDFADSLARRGPAVAYALAVVAIAAGVAARVGLDLLLEHRTTFLFFVPAVVLAAALAGFWPGLFATILGALAGLAIEMFGDGISAGDVIGATLFLIIGGALTIGGADADAPTPPPRRLQARKRGMWRARGADQAPHEPQCRRR